MFPKSGSRFSEKIMLEQEVTIDTALVSRLVATQFPRWKDLAVRPVASGGWDNRTFHLGDHMLVRLPSAAAYASQVEKEHRWLPRLAPLLPLLFLRPDCPVADPCLTKSSHSEGRSMSAPPLIRLPAPSPRIVTGRRCWPPLGALSATLEIVEIVREGSLSPRHYTGRNARQGNEGQRSRSDFVLALCHHNSEHSAD